MSVYIYRPNDSRYSNALGEVYERTQKLHEAKKCYWRSYCVGDIEGNALAKYAQ
jgi:anaphase-promoting complex subunit 8